MWLLILAVATSETSIKSVPKLTPHQINEHAENKIRPPRMNISLQHPDIAPTNSFFTPLA
jgi:hypothetical protein